MKRLAILLISFLLITILFLIGVFVFNNQNGKGALQVTATPSAEVILDGKSVGRTPICLCDLPKLITTGEHQLKLVPQGNLKEYDQKITIYKEVLTVVDRDFKEGAGASSGSIITLSPINKDSSQLLVISSPNNSKVVVDSNLAGNTPLLLKDITTSDHEVRILKDGYEEKVLKIKTIAGKRLEANISLALKNKPAAVASSSAKSVTILETPVGYLRVRAEPSVESEQITTVNPGDVLPLLDEKENWYKVKLDDGKTGWVSSSYATKSD